MSHILPPFVLSVENAAAYFDPSSVIRDTDKKSVTTVFRLSSIKTGLACLLQDSADRRYLRA